MRNGGTDVQGSPRAGSTEYALPAGAYTVAAEAVAGYALSLGGDCAGNGTVTLGQGQTRTCTVTADDVPPQSSPPPPQDEELPPPQAGEEVNALPKSGTVRG